MSRKKRGKGKSVKDERRPLAVVLLSGGMDSLATAGLASANGNDLALIHFNYGQKTERAEQRSFQAIASWLKVPEERRIIVHTNFFLHAGGSALVDKERKIPKADLESKEIPPTYVPFRNAVFLSMAVGWAEVLGAESVYYGAVSQDSSGYPDCREEFVAAFNLLVEAGTKAGGAIEVKAPLVNFRKAEIVEVANGMGLPLEKTWSCYARNDKACGKCDSCALRLRGFEEAGLEDPIAYAPSQEVVTERLQRLSVLLKALTKRA